MAPSKPHESRDLLQIFHPPDYQPHPLHVALVLTELLGRISPAMLTPAWIAMGAIACWPWDGFRVPVFALMLSITLLDGLGLALLPQMGRSFGPVTPPLLALTLVRTGITVAGGLLWGTQPALIGVTGVHTVISVASIYATWIEPFRIQVTQETLSSPKLKPMPSSGSGSSLRILHISDLHVERVTERERELLRLVDDLKPDLTVLTGDYLNLSSVRDPDAHADARHLLAELCERSSGPIYAITGSPPVDLENVVPDIFEGLDITWLLDQVEDVEINDHRLILVGLRCTRERSRDAPRLRRLMVKVPSDAFKLLLYHSPDLMPEAVDLGADLYLCGHTHGGQIRLPLLGALVTSSAFWKRYEMGRYEEAETTLYVSRGLGMEGMGAPRARFLSPPEIVLWTISTAAFGKRKMAI